MLKTYLLLFFIYSFVGWVAEVFAKVIEKGKIINRGFLIGPICPIYGCGAVLMILLLNDFNNNPILLFLLAIIICSVLEYLTSYVLERLFNARWWDYSNKKFNINGRICINTMIPFGILALLMTYVFNPFIYGVLENISTVLLNVIIITFTTLFLIDVIVSVSIFFKFKKTLLLSSKDNTEELLELKKSEIKTDKMYQHRLLNLFPSALQMERFIKENYSKTKGIINARQIILKKETELKIKSLKNRYDNKIANIKRKSKSKLKKINQKNKIN